MKTALRFGSLALAGAVNCAGVFATLAAAAPADETEPLPGIFAPKRVSEPPAPPVLLMRRTGNSERVSAMIRERVMERVKDFDATALPITRPAGEVSAVVMEKFVVSTEKFRQVDPDEKLSPALRFLKTGRFYESRDGTTTGDFRLIPVKPPGALPKEDVMRVEISFTKKF